MQDFVGPVTVLLLYSYCCGIRIAKACRERVDFMSIVGLDAPDFRKRHLKALIRQESAVREIRTPRSTRRGLETWHGRRSVQNDRPGQRRCCRRCCRRHGQGRDRRCAGRNPAGRNADASCGHAREDQGRRA
jgi:hypothetical protein